MHMIIKAIVYGDDEKEALAKGKEIFDGLCRTEDGSGVFDYYTTFDEENTQVSGKARWGNLPPVSRADSKIGKKFINEGFKYTKNNFMENIKKIKDTLKDYTDEELFEEKVITKKSQIVKKLVNAKDYDLKMFKYYCNCVGQYSGSEIYLYDNDGSGIRNTEHLKEVLTKWNEGKKVWVVLADVHM